MLFQRLADWRRRRILTRHPIDDADWQVVREHWPLLAELSAEEERRLREQATLFLHAKALEGAGDFTITPSMAAAIAAQACLPLMNLSLDALRGWYAVLVYADTFVADHPMTDEAGVLHEGARELAGEAWEQGPLILAWEDVRPDHARDIHGNVAIHEMAHKLDMQNGDANGMPPLHRDMSRPEWTRTFQAAWDALEADVEAHPEEPVIDPYALTDPGEFFAVVSEYFFVYPNHLDAAFPALYQQLAAFYRQDPRVRRAPL